MPIAAAFLASSTLWTPLRPIGSLVCLRNHSISFQESFGSMKPPTLRPIPPPFESVAILPPDMPEA